MAAALAAAAALLAAPGSASAAAPLTVATGGIGVSWATLPTSTGTYAITRASKARKQIVRVTRVGAAGVSAAPAPAIEPQTRLSTALSEDGTAPCMGAMVKDSPYVACLQGDAWVERRFSGAARTRVLLDIERYGASLYAYLADGDPGVFSGSHPERFKLPTSLVRWDGAAWVPVVARYDLSLKHLASALPCSPQDAPLCATPLFQTVRTGSPKISVEHLEGSAFVADSRGFGQRKHDTAIGAGVSFGDRLALPVFSSGKVDALTVLTDSTAPARIRVATIFGTYADAILAFAGGRPWIAWTDYFYFDKQETRGLVVGRAAPLDLATGTAGPATEVYSEAFKNLPSSVDIHDVDGLPYAEHVVHGAGADTLVLTPLPVS